MIIGNCKGTARDNKENHHVDSKRILACHKNEANVIQIKKTKKKQKQTKKQTKTQKQKNKKKKKKKQKK